MWEELLREPAPESWLPITGASWHYARGLALATLGRVDEAEAERALFEKGIALVPESASFGNNRARVVLEVGKALLAGRSSTGAATSTRHSH